MVVVERIASRLASFCSSEMDEGISCGSLV
jgi:hypothetical protein